MGLILALTARTQTPLELRIALIALLLVFLSIYALNPSWLANNRILSTLPVQRFKWKSETLLSSVSQRSGSMISSALALSIFIYGHFYSPAFHLLPTFPLRFVELFILIVLLFLFKMYVMKLFFSAHDQAELGDMVIDYHYAYNQMLAIGVSIVLCVDVFILRLNSDFYLLMALILALLYIVRILGNIILLMNKFNYSIVSLFIYLCAFEIAPMLITAKLLFDNS